MFALPLNGGEEFICNNSGTNPINYKVICLSSLMVGSTGWLKLARAQSSSRVIGLNLVIQTFYFSSDVTLVWPQICSLEIAKREIEGRYSL